MHTCTRVPLAYVELRGMYRRELERGVEAARREVLELGQQLAERTDACSMLEAEKVHPSVRRCARLWSVACVHALLAMCVCWCVCACMCMYVCVRTWLFVAR